MTVERRNAYIDASPIQLIAKSVDGTVRVSGVLDAAWAASDALLCLIVSEPTSWTNRYTLASSIGTIV